MYGLSDSLVEQIKAIAERHEVLKLVLFGSRARGNYRENSDIDLAAFGLLPRNEMTFLSDLDDLPTLLKIDTVVIRDGVFTASRSRQSCPGEPATRNC